MKILVCVKQVPSTSNVQVDPVTGVLIRDGVESKLNPYDLYALEMAFELTARYGGGVDVISMGPPQAKEVAYEAVWMGAERGAIVSDRRFAGADVLATGYTLSQGIARMGRYDIIICGKQTTDGDTAQVGAEIAEFMKLPHAGNVSAVTDISDGKVTFIVNLDNFVVTERLTLPCLLCVDSDINTPRLPSYKRKKELGDGMVSTITLDDFSDKDEMNYGLTGSPTNVERIFPPERCEDKKMFSGNSQALSDTLYGLLRERKFI